MRSARRSWTSSATRGPGARGQRRGGVGARAARLGDELGVRFQSDPWALADALEVSVWWRPLAGRLRELYLNGRGFSVVVLCDRLRPRTAREFLAHGLGHHLLHVPADPAKRRVVGTASEEREADHFAACFLLPQSRLRPLLTGPPHPSASELARRFDVDHSVLAARIA